jgi:hypothetical protein
MIFVKVSTIILSKKPNKCFTKVKAEDQGLVLITVKEKPIQIHTT